MPFNIAIVTAPSTFLPPASSNVWDEEVGVGSGCALSKCCWREEESGDRFQHMGQIYSSADASIEDAPATTPCTLPATRAGGKRSVCVYVCVWKCLIDSWFIAFCVQLFDRLAYHLSWDSTPTFPLERSCLEMRSLPRKFHYFDFLEYDVFFYILGTEALQIYDLVSSSCMDHYKSCAHMATL